MSQTKLGLQKSTENTRGQNKMMIDLHIDRNEQEIRKTETLTLTLTAKQH